MPVEETYKMRNLLHHLKAAIDLLYDRKLTQNEKQIFEEMLDEYSKFFTKPHYRTIWKEHENEESENE